MIAIRKQRNIEGPAKISTKTSQDPSAFVTEIQKKSLVIVDDTIYDLLFKDS